MTRTYSRYPGSLICAAWRYHQLNNADEPADIAISLGGHDIRVAEHAAELYAQRMVPRILFTGTTHQRRASHSLGKKQMTLQNGR